MTGYSISAYERSFPSGNCKECNWWGKKRLLGKLKMHTSDCLVGGFQSRELSPDVVCFCKVCCHAFGLAAGDGWGGEAVGARPCTEPAPISCCHAGPQEVPLEVVTGCRPSGHTNPTPLSFPPPSTPWLQPSLSALFSSINLCELWLAFATFLLMLLTIIDHLGLWQTTEQYQ